MTGAIKCATMWALVFVMLALAVQFAPRCDASAPTFHLGTIGGFSVAGCS